MTREEAIEYIKNTENISSRFQEALETIIPELKVSEDEKIRKSLIILLQHFCRGYRVPGLNFPVSYKDMLSWLEKQGEQKPADKIESKFKVGDWVVNGKGEVAYIADVKIDPYGTLRYYLEWTNGNKSTPMPCFVDDNFHLWVIQDTKAGDVLYDSNSESILLFRSQTCGWIKIYCDYWFTIDKFTVSDCSDYGRISEMNLSPATREQCNLLFSKMKEAGYEWDAEKKELKKINQNLKDFDSINYDDEIANLCDGSMSLTDKDIARHFYELRQKFSSKEQKPTEWNEENSKVIETLIKELRTNAQFELALRKIGLDYVQTLSTLAKCPRLKQVWSEEDESMCNDTIQFIEKGWTDNGKSHLIPWLKSLKERFTWKPSEEQMKELENMYKYHAVWNEEVIESLYNDLKLL